MKSLKVKNPKSLTRAQLLKAAKRIVNRDIVHDANIDGVVPHIQRNGNLRFEKGKVNRAFHLFLNWVCSNCGMTNCNVERNNPPRIKKACHCCKEE